MTQKSHNIYDYYGYYSREDFLALPARPHHQRDIEYDAIVLVNTSDALDEIYDCMTVIGCQSQKPLHIVSEEPETVKWWPPQAGEGYMQLVTCYLPKSRGMVFTIRPDASAKFRSELDVNREMWIRISNAQEE